MIYQITGISRLDPQIMQTHNEKSSMRVKTKHIGKNTDNSDF